MLILQDVVFDQENWKMLHVSGPAEGINCKCSTWKHFFLSVQLRKIASSVTKMSSELLWGETGCLLEKQNEM